MKKNTKLLVLAYVVLIGGYAGFRYSTSTKVEVIGSIPKITVPEGTLELSVKAKDKDLLEGIIATDKEDGVLTKQVFVQNISAFGANDIRQVTYGVFDGDDNYTSVVRSIHYTNYKPPVIKLKKALVYNYVTSKATFADYVLVESSVDGDISSNATVNREYTQDGDHFVEFSVTDSTGTTAIQTFKALKSDKTINLNIQLKNYVVYLKKGKTVNPKKNIEGIFMNKMDYSDMIDDVNIKTDFRENTTGQFEYIYSLKTKNDDYGLTKLVVIVED